MESYSFDWDDITKTNILVNKITVTAGKRRLHFIFTNTINNYTTLNREVQIFTLSFKIAFSYM